MKSRIAGGVLSQEVQFMEPGVEIKERGRLSKLGYPSCEWQPTPADPKTRRGEFVGLQMTGGYEATI